ncbi:tripartite tricarboxylate transporter substrate binding protein [Pusillimonas sp. ANT_WB101]|uniref:Bug family tripartite tricarboxylate transporter substrate binding protein n=1 Tax=Pusillimonas sp. ANT_WB101 TaxID=2597356 RepID=UPI0011EECE51|nr:tripartite tricarboxylate transporter substrate binding protein [Pusillimonas sp. ANT_WB101]KAA0889998.1 tripartite tricarboxylate transporter substrate binding protein [Pusillimonas sp. ANT_WB101]
MKRLLTFLLTLSISSFSLAPLTSHAKTIFPDRPLKLMVGYAPGGPADILARLVAQGMSAKLGQPVIVENRPGAASSIAAGAVANAPPDGYTLLWGPSTPMVMNPVLRTNLGYNPTQDFTQLGMIADMVLVLVANNSVEIQSLSDLITQSKANPKKFFYGTSGAGSAMNVAAEKLKFETGINMDHVPFNGSAPNLSALMGGDIQIASDLTVAVMPLILSGKIKPIAVMSAKRLEQLPNVPTVAETIPGFEFSTFQAVQAPANLPEPIKLKLEETLKAVVNTPEFKRKLIDLNFIPAYSDGASAQARIEKEIASYQIVAKQANIKID